MCLRVLAIAETSRSRIDIAKYRCTSHLVTYEYVNSRKG